MKIDVVPSTSKKVTTEVVTPGTVTLTLSMTEAAVLATVCGDVTGRAAWERAVHTRRIKAEDITPSGVSNLLAGIFYINTAAVKPI